MKHLSFWILAWCITVTAAAQNSNDFDKGKSLYNERRYKESLPYLQSTAKAGNPEAQYMVGWCFLLNDRDATTTINMWQRAAVQNYEPAIVSLGDLYLSAHVKNDPAKAIAFYQQAVKSGNVEAISKLARIYENGQIVPKDEVKAFNLCKDAVATIKSEGRISDFPDIYLNEIIDQLGYMYLNGLGTETDLDAALATYEINANVIHHGVTALIAMAHLHSRGSSSASSSIKAAQCIQELTRRNVELPAEWIDSVYVAAQAAQDELDFDEKAIVIKEYSPHQEAIASVTKAVQNNLTYPKDAAKKQIQGRVMVEMTIDEEGKITNIHVTKGVYPSLDAETVRVVSLAMPVKPYSRIKSYKNIQKTETLPMKFSMPIVFALQ